MKTKIKTLLLLTCCVFFINCDEKETDLELNSELINETQFGFVSQGRTSNALSYSEIVSMLYHYDKTRSEALMNGLGKEDNRSVFFSKENLKSFIDEVETISNAKGIEFTGVSFLSTAYPMNHPDESKRGERTLVLMPTTKVGADNTIIFDPIQSGVNEPSTLNQIISDFGFEGREKIFNDNINVMNKVSDMPSIGIADKELGYKDIISMLAEYNSHKASLLEKAVGKEDVRKSSFDLEGFKSYLAYVEELSKEKNIHLSGINILFGAYPEDYSIDPIKRNYMSLVLMPVTTVNGQNVMFDPLNSEIGKPRMVEDILSSYGYNYKSKLSNRLNMSWNRSEDDLESSGANRGQLSPPY